MPVPIIINSVIVSFAPQRKLTGFVNFPVYFFNTAFRHRKLRGIAHLQLSVFIAELIILRIRGGNLRPVRDNLINARLLCVNIALILHFRLL